MDSILEDELRSLIYVIDHPSYVIVKKNCITFLQMLQLMPDKFSGHFVLSFRIILATTLINIEDYTS